MRWTDTQMRRLKELNAQQNNLELDFSTTEERNSHFQITEKMLVQSGRQELETLLRSGFKPKVERLRDDLIIFLTNMGFTQVSTPTIISRQFLERMTVDATNPLFNQVFWINERQCLRPMLAPNLYSLMRDLQRLKHQPLRLFEIGSCFRKESDGAQHTNEFTMLNLVEMGVEMDEREERLKYLGENLTSVAGIKKIEFVIEDSKVYGTTLDILSGEKGVELASGAMGPHPLDNNWGVVENWVGLGFGLERLVMVAQGSESISKWSRSISYLDGIRLHL